MRCPQDHSRGGCRVPGDPDASVTIHLGLSESAARRRLALEAEVDLCVRNATIGDVGALLGSLCLADVVIPATRVNETVSIVDDELAASIARDVADGLAHAHGQGVVHRDLKPANVLFDEEGHAKVGDFGVARLAAGADTFTTNGSILGTALYMAPEQATGTRVGPAATCTPSA